MHCFTMTNIRCNRGKEIDLLALNPSTKEKYHVESRVLTTFELKEKASKRLNGRTRRDGLDYFQKEKFEPKEVSMKIKEFFGDSDYVKVLVVYDTTKPTYPFIQKAFKKYGMKVVLIRDIIADLKEDVKVRGSRDDVVRFVELVAHEDREKNRQMRKIFQLWGKESGLSKTPMWKRLMGSMRIEKRSEFGKSEVGKILKISKTSTEFLREKNETVSQNEV